MLLVAFDGIYKWGWDDNLCWLSYVILLLVCVKHVIHRITFTSHCYFLSQNSQVLLQLFSMSLVILWSKLC